MDVKPPEVLVFIDVSVDTAMERIRKRSRSTEADLIPRDYMEDLKLQYDRWYEEFDLCPKIKIDWNESFEDNPQSLKSMIIEKIKPYIKQGIN